MCSSRRNIMMGDLLWSYINGTKPWGPSTKANNISIVKILDYYKWRLKLWIKIQESINTLIIYESHRITIVRPSSFNHHHWTFIFRPSTTVPWLPLHAYYPPTTIAQPQPTNQGSYHEPSFTIIGLWSFNQWHPITIVQLWSFDHHCMTANLWQSSHNYSIVTTITNL